jgi:anti-sigma B factor antagonist
MAVNVRQENGVIIFEPTGRLIGRGINELRDAINEHLTDDIETPKLLFNFAGVSTVDSSGLGVLMSTHLSVTQKKGRIAVINVSNSIKNLIIRSRLISTFEHFHSEDVAIAELTADS